MVKDLVRTLRSRRQGRDPGGLSEGGVEGGVEERQCKGGIRVQSTEDGKIAVQRCKSERSSCGKVERWGVEEDYRVQSTEY